MSDEDEEDEKVACECRYCGSDDIESCNCTGSECDCCGNCMNHCRCEECAECKELTDDAENCDNCDRRTLCPDCLGDHDCHGTDKDEEEEETPESPKPKELPELGPGDKVIEGYGPYARVRTIDRVTATQIVIGGTRYNRQNGRECGKSRGFHHSSIHVATQERLDRCEIDQLQSRLAGMRRDDLQHLTLHQLRTISEIIGTK